ncbi:sulfur carrier protein ThiS (plasmid) [Paroceanicella profunda]|uniref:Sulfur carrier protein ThiS n=1 Tax=Paroceanicella profunda TaxID=2579971 RepID=A0A5B8FJ45_9RHOB|nr:sulfur carrier protein ThiS [Paroceanicella profunda]QDL93828.1 sulfur carrier protein ThiS [Paroceanicella profunda]
MKIFLNGEPREIRASRLDEALTELGYADARVATALDGAFVPAPARPDTRLAPGCALEVLAPMQGG